MPARSARFARVVTAEAAVLGRQAIVDEIVTGLGQRRPTAAAVVADSGAGRSAVADALAARLDHATGPLAGKPVVRVASAPLLAADAATGLGRVLEDLSDDAVVFLDDVDVLAGLDSAHPNPVVLDHLRAAAYDATALVVVLTPHGFSRLEALDQSLADALHRVDLPALARPDLEQIVHSEAATLAAHHGVRLDETVALSALRPAPRALDIAQPGLAVRRLDAACVRASVREDAFVREDDLRLETSRDVPVDRRSLAEALAGRVLGQSVSIDRVADRIALTSARLDLRPERPDGVFLFVGPTGVGKTELAKAISSEVFGPDVPLIRLDMSEYADSWAQSRLTGPQPGFVGSTEPDSWLTTKVHANPRSVVLLDEIEKAHPSIWNTFLQVFDAGRLTDSRGVTADFSQSVVAMTSNLGARAFSGGSLGFGAEGDTAARDEAKVMSAVRETMAPELINRLDAVLVFRPLDQVTIRQIAEAEVLRTVDQLAVRGYDLSVASAVIDLLAAVGYDPAFGARHLQRNIERLLLQPLLDAGSGRLQAQRDGDAVVWHTY